MAHATASPGKSNPTKPARIPTLLAKQLSIHEVHSVPFASVIGGLLCLISGWINAVSARDFESTVTHLSGTSTALGRTLALRETEDAGKSALKILMFCVGCVVSSAYLGAKRQFKGGPRYAHVLALVSLLVFLAYACHKKDEGFSGVLLLSVASGLQNAMMTAYGGTVVRTTHVTGTVTDMGIELGKVIFHRDHSGTWKLALLSALLFSYILGGYVGTLLSVEYEVTSLLFPASMLLAMSVVYLACLHALPRSKRGALGPKGSMGLFFTSSWKWPQHRWLKARREGTVSDQEGSHSTATGSSDANVGMLRTVFDQIDADGNGTLDKDEVAAALRIMGKTEAEVRELVAFMPSDELTFAGFQDLLQGDWYESLDAAGPSRPDRTMSAEERRRRQESLAAASDARGPIVDAGPLILDQGAGLDQCGGADHGKQGARKATEMEPSSHNRSSMDSEADTIADVSTRSRPDSFDHISIQVTAADEPGAQENSSAASPPCQQLLSVPASERSRRTSGETLLSRIGLSPRKREAEASLKDALNEAASKQMLPISASGTPSSAEVSQRQTRGADSEIILTGTSSSSSRASGMVTPEIENGLQGKLSALQYKLELSEAHWQVQRVVDHLKDEAGPALAIHGQKHEEWWV